MGYTIYTVEQVQPQMIERPGILGMERVENPQLEALPAGCAIAYATERYSRFAVTVFDRTVVLSDPAGTATMAEILERFPKALDGKINQLWRAAHGWEEKFISGVGLSVLAVGVAMGRPKAAAVSAWTQILWSIYYQRKASLSLDSQPDLDFSAAGIMPYSVPELAAEVQG